MPPLQALSQLDLAARPRLLGVFTDFDGTLTTNDQLVPAAYERLFRAHQAGLRTILVTGRPGGYAEVLGNTFAVDAAIAENGAVAMIRRRTGAHWVLERLYWDSAEVRHDQLARLELVIERVRREMPHVKLADDRWLRKCDIAFDIGETVSLPKQEIDRLRDCMQAAGARVLISTIHAHAFFGDHDKAAMLERVVAHLWQEDLASTRDRYVYLGDSPNDQAAFAYFPLSIGVANVRDYAAHLHPPPAYVTEQPGGAGFAEAIDKILGQGRSPE